MVAMPEQQSAVEGALSEVAPEEVTTGTAASGVATGAAASGEVVAAGAAAAGAASGVAAGAASGVASGAASGEVAASGVAASEETTAPSPLVSVIPQPPQVLWISPAEPPAQARVVPLPDAALEATKVSVAESEQLESEQHESRQSEGGHAAGEQLESGQLESGQLENGQDEPRKKKHERRTKDNAKGHEKSRAKGKAKSRTKGRRGHTRRLFLIALRDMLIALALLVLLLQFFSPTIVREHSMENTLKENEILYIARRAYWFGEPQHGDIVVFHITLSDDSGDGKTLVKRIIGIPGDRITISGGVVYRNDRPLDEAYVKGGMTLGDLNDLVVPDDSYFVLGDNREVSNDSRNADIGFVEKSQLRGKVMVRIFPLSEFRVF
jgi:signal peptidase I